MTEYPSSKEEVFDLSEVERARIRAEMRYAHLVTQETSSRDKPRSVLKEVLGFLSNGFVLLLVGSLITSFLVPRFQREADARKQQASLMQESLAQFLLYSNSIWQEYYSILPLTQQSEINKEEYIRYTNQLAEIKLKRYDAYAKVLALAVVFRKDESEATTADAAIRQHAIRLNIASAAIDKWLTDLYCTPTKREESPCETFDPTFDSFSEYMKIKNLVVEIGNAETDSVASLMVEQLNQP